MRISDWSSDVCSSDLGLETWRITLIVVSLPTILFGVLFAATVVEPLRCREVAIIGGKPATADLKSMVPFILPLVIGAGAPMILAAGYAAWAPETLMTEYGLSLGSAGAWFGVVAAVGPVVGSILLPRSEEHTSELQSLMRI